MKQTILRFLALSILAVGPFSGCNCTAQVIGGDDEWCGDDIVNLEEVCDGADLAGGSCADLDFSGGSLACLADCSGFDTAACTGDPGVCGDGVIDAGEACDIGSLAGETCITQGFAGGALSCLGDCSGFDTTGCTGCGNDVIETGETCDGTDLGAPARTCVDEGFAGGALACLGDCSDYDTSGCGVEFCGDNTKNGTELCDGSDLGTETCEDHGMTSGAIACDVACDAWVFSGCLGCGNGVQDGTELCDGADVGAALCADYGLVNGTLSCDATCNDFDFTGCLGCGSDSVDGTEVCDGADLDGYACVDFGLTDNVPAGLVLTCANDCASFDTSLCLGCGSNQIDGTETCDGPDLGGATCLSEGLDGGLLACNSTCDDFITTGCTDCGDNNQDLGEACDGSDLGANTSCTDFGLTDGALACSASCDGWDLSGCLGCGNGIYEASNGEECDGADLNSQTCASFSLTDGALACAADCTLDLAGCLGCGSGTIDGSEACDGAELAGQSCLTQGFSTGTLSCASDCLTFDTSACTACGNDTLEGSEVCDGAELSGEDCISQSFDGGVLACLGDCSGYDTSRCGSCASCAVGAACIDGLCKCAPGAKDCGGVCVSLLTDPNNCGDCGIQCTGDQACSAGKCMDDCQTPLVKCSNECVDPFSDHRYCGMDESCIGGEDCIAVHGQYCDDRTTVCASDVDCVGVSPLEVCLPAAPCIGGTCVADTTVPVRPTFYRCTGDSTIPCSNDGDCGADGPCGDYCLAGGPPICLDETGTCDGGGTLDCAGNLGAVTFRWALCSCADVSVNAATFTDAFDTGLGPYEPDCASPPNCVIDADCDFITGVGGSGSCGGTYCDLTCASDTDCTSFGIGRCDQVAGLCTLLCTADSQCTNADDAGTCADGLGGGIGANASISASAQPPKIWGTLWASNSYLPVTDPGITISAALVKQNLRSGGVVSSGGALVEGDGRVAGDVAGSGGTFNGDLEVSTSSTVDAPPWVIGGATTTTAPVCDGDKTACSVDADCTGHGNQELCRLAIGPPCDCGDPTIGQDPSQLVDVTGIVASHSCSGATADTCPAPLNNIDIGLDPDVMDSGNDARLDLPCGHYYLSAITGNVEQVIYVTGNTALYIGGNITAQTVIFMLAPTATLDVFVYGTICLNQGSVIGSPNYPARTRFYVAGNPPACQSGQTVRITSDVTIAANLYSPYGLVNFIQTGVVYGGIIAGEFDSGQALAIHFDRAIADAGDDCPTDCGNPTIDAFEACDGANLGTPARTCADEGFDGGTLLCVNCQLDTSLCIECGNGVREGLEQCDGADVGTYTCEGLGFDGGTLDCRADCIFDTNLCTSCGDGVRDGVEECDGGDLGGFTCASLGLGYTGGTLSCYPAPGADACLFDTSGCTTCGNGAIEGSEVCDDTDLGGETCITQGFTGGVLSCNATCTGYIFNCTGIPDCGNGVQAAPELCDGADLNSTSCVDLGFDDGTLACIPAGDVGACTFDTSGCWRCGNGVQEGSEACDGTDLGVHTCITEGFDGGTIACLADCTLNTNGCFGCGNDIIESGEECEPNIGLPETCVSLGFDGGTLACFPTGDANECLFDSSLCYTCNDGTLDAGEDCDGSELGGETCNTLGFAGGVLTCNGDCTFNTSACTGCGDGVINGTEECDGTALGGETCVGLGFDCGLLACLPQGDANECTFDTSGCVTGSCTGCGNNTIDGDEICDGPDLGSPPHTCQDEGFLGGVLGCNGTCDGWDTSGCYDCLDCRDCLNQACNDGTCGACTTSDDCCAPWWCYIGQCYPDVD